MLAQDVIRYCWGIPSRRFSWNLRRRSGGQGCRRTAPPTTRIREHRSSNHRCGKIRGRERNPWQKPERNELKDREGVAPFYTSGRCGRRKRFALLGALTGPTASGQPNNPSSGMLQLLTEPKIRSKVHCPPSKERNTNVFCKLAVACTGEFVVTCRNE